ncbi:MAG: glycosyltransferase, partial [Bacteroidetes bacterium]
MSRRKIICTVTNDLTHDRRMHRICTTLSGAGFEVELVGRRLPHSQPLPRRAFRQVRLRCFFHRGKLFYLEYNLRLFLYLMPRRAGALCAVDLDTLCAGWLAARLRGWKLVYDAHEFFQEVPEVVGRPFTQRVWEGVARALIPRVDAAYTVSASLAEELSKHYGVSFGLVRNLPPRPALPTHAEKHHPPVLLYQGVLNEGRGLEEAIEA